MKIKKSIYRVHAVKNSQEKSGFGDPKLGQSMILIKVGNSQEKVRIFVIFYNMELDFDQKWIKIYISYSFQSFQ